MQSFCVISEHHSLLRWLGMTRSLSQLWCPELLLGFHYAGMTEWITIHMARFPVPILIDGADITWLKALALRSHDWSFWHHQPHPESHWHKLGCVLGEPTMDNKNIIVTREISRVQRFPPKNQRQRPVKFLIALDLHKYHSFPSLGPCLLSMLLALGKEMGLIDRAYVWV